MTEFERLMEQGLREMRKQASVSVVWNKKTFSGLWDDGNTREVLVDGGVIEKCDPAVVLLKDEVKALCGSKVPKSNELIKVNGREYAILSVSEDDGDPSWTLNLKGADE